MVSVPATRRGDVIEVLHGESVADPYRWLEDTDSEETAAWVRAQNAATSDYLSSLPHRDEIRERLTELWDVTRWGAPYEHGGRWFFTRHDAGADQPVLLVADSPDGDGRVLIDPNTMSGDGTAALTYWAASRDGRWVAYAISRSGSDWMTWRVREADTGRDLDEVIEWSKFSSAAWLPDSSGFYYEALEPPAPGREYLDSNEALRLVLHRLGEPAAADRVVYVDPDPHWEPEAWVTEDGRWLVMELRQGTNLETITRVLDLTDPTAEFTPLIPSPTCEARVVGSDGTTFYVLTDLAAPMKRVVAVDLDAPEVSAWRTVVPAASSAIQQVERAGGRLLVHLLEDASSRLQVWSTAGEQLGVIELPEFVSITEISASDRRPTVHVGLTSFTDPGSVWECDVDTGHASRVRHSALPVDADAIVVSRAAATSAEGTQVPMFLVHRRDASPDGDVPALLYGYGGYNIPILPAFNAARLVWAERGGLVAMANLRGGGEYGREWYDAGRLANKQNVFDDFAGCARWLAESGWSRPQRIVVNGGSNGGLLVGALLTQHPELIGAAIPEVGVLDMLRYHLFTIGWAWMSDYGNPDDPAQYQWVRAFSPLHSVRPGTAYPATLVMTGDHDDRVVPGHSFKFAATLQAAQGGDAPVVIRIETAGGHGDGTPVHKLIEARADMLAFAEAALAG